MSVSMNQFFIMTFWNSPFFYICASVCVPRRGEHHSAWILFKFGKTVQVQVISIVAEMECVFVYNIVAWYTSLTPRGDAGRQPAHSGGAGCETGAMITFSFGKK